MLFLILTILVNCAVKCDDASNYYVIEMQEDELPNKQTFKDYKVYWNVPTMQCKSKKVPFEDLYAKYGIIQNEEDHFRGENIAILYDPGIFPALLKNESSGGLIFRNGGVPQEGDLDRHLKAFAKVLEQSLREDFSGVGIIDFESWRPIYRQNFGVLAPYKDVSYEIERNRHWWWTHAWLQAEATRRFEESAVDFMKKSLVVAKQLRPKAEWGYYAYPYCFNMAGKHLVERCADNVSQENDRISWLWSESTALYPSLYSSKDLSTQQLQQLIRGRIKEAKRINRNNSPILPYFWFRYRDAGYMNENDLEGALQTLYRSGASGFIIWGSSNDVNSKEKCSNLLNYVEKTLGPAIAKYTKYRKKETHSDDVHNDINISNVTTTPQPNITNSSLDPELEWDPPENYTQDIISYVQKEFYKKSNDSESSTTNSIISETGNKFRRIESNDSSNLDYVKSASENSDIVYKENKISTDLDNNSSIISIVSQLTESTKGIDLNTQNTDLNESTINVTSEINFIHTTELSSTSKVNLTLNNKSESTNDSSASILMPTEIKILNYTNVDTIEIDRQSNKIEINGKSSKNIKKGLRNLSISENKNTNNNNQNFASIIKLADNIYNSDEMLHNTEKLISSTSDPSPKFIEPHNSIRHSKNRKKGRRRNEAYVPIVSHENEVNKQPSIIDHSNKGINESIIEFILNDANTRSPEVYRRNGTKNEKKGFKEIKVISGSENVKKSDITTEPNNMENENNIHEKIETTSLSTESSTDINISADKVIIYEVIQA